MGYDQLDQEILQMLKNPCMKLVNLCWSFRARYENRIEFLPEYIDKQATHWAMFCGCANR